MPALRPRRARDRPPEKAEIDERGFVLSPRAVWIETGIPASAPEYTLVPAYGPAAYIVKDELRRPNITPATIASFGWDPVRVTTAESADDGVVYAEGRGYTRYGCGWSCGLVGDKIESIRRIGRIHFDPTARLGTRLRYAEILAWIRPEVVATRREGASVGFDIRVSPDGRPPEIPDATAALELLVRAGLVSEGQAVGSTVAAYSVETPTLRKPLPNLDRMTHEHVREFFEQPWPMITVTVTVRKPRLLRKRVSFRRFAIRANANWRE